MKGAGAASDAACRYTSLPDEPPGRVRTMASAAAATTTAVIDAILGTSARGPRRPVRRPSGPAASGGPRPLPRLRRFLSLRLRHVPRRPPAAVAAAPPARRAPERCPRGGRPDGGCALTGPAPDVPDFRLPSAGFRSSRVSQPSQRSRVVSRWRGFPNCVRLARHADQGPPAGTGRPIRRAAVVPAASGAWADGATSPGRAAHAVRDWRDALVAVVALRRHARRRRCLGLWAAGGAGLPESAFPRVVAALVVMAAGGYGGALRRRRVSWPGAGRT